MIDYFIFDKYMRFFSSYLMKLYTNNFGDIYSRIH